MSAPWSKGVSPGPRQGLPLQFPDTRAPCHLSLFLCPSQSLILPPPLLSLGFSLQESGCGYQAGRACQAWPGKARRVPGPLSALRICFGDSSSSLSPHPALFQGQSLLTWESQGSQGPSEGLGRFACGGKAGGWGGGQASPPLPARPTTPHPCACSSGFQRPLCPQPDPTPQPRSLQPLEV